MTETKMRVRTTLVALAGMAVLLGLMAGPAAAQSSGHHTSGEALATEDSTASGACVAIDDSVCSGSGLAVNDSTSSGSAVARDGSVSSGCATAIDDSTASGAPCPPAKKVTHDHPKKHGAPAGRGGGVTPTAGATLALTGSSSAELAGLATLALVVGGLLVLAGTRRPAES